MPKCEKSERERERACKNRRVRKSSETEGPVLLQKKKRRFFYKVFILHTSAL